jgi:adenine-specific DNA-methyltransferase
MTDSDSPGQEPELVEAENTARGRGRAAAAAQPTEVLSYRHSDTRVNNPEVGVVKPDNDPDVPKTRWAYDPHIDPALMFDSARSRVEKVIDDALASGDAGTMKSALEELRRMQAPYLAWAGKAERTSFEVDTVSLHVHERIDPASILASVKKRLADGGEVAWRQPDLFAAPFEKLPLRQAIDFYKHERGWANRLIAGDSLLVMNSLLQKESMAGKVQMIYFDPPYGIKYGSNFQPFVSKRDVKDGADEDLTQEPEMIKAFRDTWELGIHSYLSYVRDRLLMCRNLLTAEGSIFIQISDENLHRITALCDEIFGSENLMSIITFVKTSGQSSELLAGVSDYIVWYAKSKESVKFRQPLFDKTSHVEGSNEYVWLREPSGRERLLTAEERKDFSKLQGVGLVFRHGPTTSQRPPGSFPFEYLGVEARPGRGYWKTHEEGLRRLARAQRLVSSGNILKYKRFIDDYPVVPIGNNWTDTATGGSSSDPRTYVVQTVTRVIERCITMTTDPGDLVFDPTCGSGTTAFSAEKWGRRWITCDTSRVAIMLAKQRVTTASFDYFHLRYPEEGLKGGFQYQTVPHVMLKSIANNPDIDTIYEARHPAIAAALAELNTALATAKPFKPAQGYRKGKAVTFATGDRLEEWEVPFDWPDNWPEAAQSAFDAFHVARRAMQADMDRVIRDHAEQETLYDKPEVDKSRLRITGPFTVEAVPAPTVLALDEAAPPAEADVSIARQGETSRQALWRGELLKTGIRAKGGAVIRIADLEAVPSCRYLHAIGTIAEGPDEGARVLVSFGPEHAALEQRQVELALDEAGKLRPAAKFIVFAAFTFDPEAAKDIDEVNWPGVTLLKAQMNTDLLTEDLKKAKSSNQSFWLMGQPEVEKRKVGDNWEIEVHGFDYYDPTKGELVSGGKSKIAMWSLDTDYDGRSLMPSQVFFPMAGDKGGWNRLKATIRAELDEELLEQFHGTVSLPFKSGDNRRVAVKIVDDRGIESLRILPLE